MSDNTEADCRIDASEYEYTTVGDSSEPVAYIPDGPENFPPETASGLAARRAVRFISSEFPDYRAKVNSDLTLIVEGSTGQDLYLTGELVSRLQDVGIAVTEINRCSDYVLALSVTMEDALEMSDSERLL